MDGETAQITRGSYAVSKQLPKETQGVTEQFQKQLDRTAEQPEKEKPLQSRTPQERNLEYFLTQMRERVTKEFQEKEEQKQKIHSHQELETLTGGEVIRESGSYGSEAQQESMSYDFKASQESTDLQSEPEQLELFDHRLLNPETKSEIKIIGQLFETYWLVQFEDKFYMIDQHAAHEKVLYERTVKSLANKEVTSQMVSPPLILTLTMQEANRLNDYLGYFTEMGFEIEPFGGREYAVSSVPGNLFGIAERELFLELLDSLESVGGKDSTLVMEKIASMSCKAAVKGSQRLSTAEARALIEELLHLENPYNCPHGRPTIISMTRQEIEKKFKRIV